MKEVLKRMEISKEKKEKVNKKDKERQKRRQIYFCIGVNKIWKGRNSIHVTIKK